MSLSLIFISHFSLSFSQCYVPLLLTCLSFCLPPSHPPSIPSSLPLCHGTLSETLGCHDSTGGGVPPCCSRVLDNSVAAKWTGSQFPQHPLQLHLCQCSGGLPPEGGTQRTSKDAARSEVGGIAGVNARLVTPERLEDARCKRS